MYIKYETDRSKFISIPWYIGSVCNYRCSYCIPDFHDGKEKFPDTYKPFIKLIDKVQKKYPGTEILAHLYGGEVTLWDKFYPLICDLNERGVGTRIVSNGSRSVEWWKKVADKISYLIVSYHMEYASEDHITEVMKLFDGNSQISFMIPPEKFDEAVEMMPRISENSETLLIPKFLRIKFTSELYPYTQEQLDFFNKTVYGGKYYTGAGKYSYGRIYRQSDDGKNELVGNVRQLYLKKLNRWKGWKCWGGIEQLFVEYNGDICVGQCRRGKFGNIYEDDYELPDEPFICDKDICNCTQDIIDCKREMDI